MIAVLASLPELFIISHTSTLKYRDAPPNPQKIGRELRVRYVLSGTVRRQGERLRIYVELFNTQTLAVIATSRMEGKTSDLFDLQDRLTERVLQMVAPNIRNAELWRVRSKRTGNLDAYEYLLRGLDLLYRLDPNEFEQAHQMFQMSINMDQDYAAPYAFTALWHSIRVNQGWSSDRGRDLGMVDEFASAALQRDGSDVWALALSGHLRAFLLSDFDTAFELFNRALRASPNSAFAWVRSSPAFSYIGNATEARRRAEEALRLSPQDFQLFFTYGVLALAAYTEGDYEAAVKWGRKSYAENPKHTPCPRTLAASLAAAGRIDEARQIGDALLRLEPGFSVRKFCGNYAYRDEDLRTRLAQHLILAGLPQ